MKIVFKQNPLSFHKDARLAAIASLAAHRQGKFWEYHDLLFANMKRLKRPDLLGYAEQLGLKMKRFEKDLDDPALDAQVQRNLDEGKKVGVRGTPNAYVNGYQVKGAAGFAAYKKIIDRELAKARGEAPPEAPKGPSLGVLEDARVEIDTKRGVVFGPRRAKDELVLFVDLQDKFAGTVLQAAVEVQQAERRRRRLVVKHFPLDFHKQARAAALATDAVFEADNDKALAFMKQVSANAEALSEDKLAELAEAQGVDGGTVRKAISDRRAQRSLDRALEEARKLGVLASPSLFINGRRYTGLKGYGKASIEAAIAASRR